MNKFALRIVMVGLMTFSNLSLASGELAYDKTVEDESKLFADIDYASIITRYSTISVSIDDLYFKVNDPTAEYFINLKIQFFSWQDGMTKPDKPIYEYGTLYKRTIQAKNGFAKLSDLRDIRIAPNVSLQNINLVSVEASIVKENATENKIASALSEMIGKPIADAWGLKLVDLLLTKQKANPSNILVFNSDFAIPLNSIEYRTLADEGKTKLLKNNVPIGIALSGSTDSNILQDSVVQQALTAVSEIFTAVAGTPDIAKKTVPYDGVLKIRFSSSLNSLIPKDLQVSIKGISDASLSEDYVKAVDWIKRSKDTVAAYSATGEGYQDLFFTTNMFCKVGTLAISTKTDFASIIDISSDKSKKWKHDIQEFDSIMFFNAKQKKFKIYGVKNLDPNDSSKIIPVYIPYTLDEQSISDFVRWQIEIKKLILDKKI